MSHHLNLIDLVFGCWHRHLSFPRSVKPGERRSAAARPTGTYVVCLDCGKQFSYDWEQMRIIGSAEQSLQVKPSLALRTVPKH